MLEAFEKTSWQAKTADFYFIMVVPTEYTWSGVLEELAILRAAGEAEEEQKKNASTVNNNIKITKKTRILTDLASYFKYGSYGYILGENETAIGVTINDEQPSIQNMLMYAILVVQSLILFIAYVKRLFYVIMLSLLAPVVVVVDFFARFIK